MMATVHHMTSCWHLEIFRGDGFLSDRVYKAMECNMSLKIHFLESLGFFSPEDLGEVSDEHGERFHQYIMAMEKWYQST
jgi:hypothetical protein